jgi:flagellar hook protein FlgE
MYSGVSGLQANGNAMSVIGNNLSNSNTTGFKAGRALFSDLLPSEVSSASGGSQVGKGVNLATVDQVFSQGTFKSTESNTDLAIEGKGMFVVGDPQSASQYYTRAGAFRFDDQGYLVNPQGYRVQGYDIDNSGNAVGTMSDIQAPVGGSIPAQATGQADFSTNLSAEATEISSGFDLSDPNGSSNFATSIKVYDSLGESHLMTSYFTLTDAADNQWEYNMTVPQSEVTQTASDPNTNSQLHKVASGTVEFDGDGKLTSFPDPPSPNPSLGSGSINNNVAEITTETLDWNNGATQGNTLNVNLDLTQYFGQSELVYKEQDGYASGSLADLTVDSEGFVNGTYSNGQTEKIAQLGLADFANENGLKSVGKNMFRATDASGLPALGTPGAGVGDIRSNTLEQSNVDIAEQFTDMITTQRAYQANARSITTTDEMLNEVVNLKR